MSLSVDVDTPPSDPVSKPRVSPDISLRSGRLLSLEEIGELARTTPTTLVTLVGPPDSGKSTLLATIHEGFRQNLFPPLTFSGSRTLVAFEELCHLSRTTSGLKEPDTMRTNFSDEEHFYHLEVNWIGECDLKQSLTIMDVAGEGFDSLRTSHDNCRAISSLKRTRFLTLLIDGDTLLVPKDRFKAIEDAVNFLRCVWDSRAVNLDCKLQVVVTKVDKLQDASTKCSVQGFISAIGHRLEGRFPSHNVLEVAARPKVGSGLQPAHGVKKLLETWLVAASSRSSGPEIYSYGCGGRESEAFLSRHFDTNSK